jgi:hypothetical protein
MLSIDTISFMINGQISECLESSCCISYDLVPECPPDVFPEDVPAEDEDPIHGVTSGVAVTASIACDAATVLPRDHVQELFQESFNQGVSSVALATQRLQRRRIRSIVEVSIIVLAQMFCLSSLVPKIQILERLDQSMV